MIRGEVHSCRCAKCQEETAHPDQERHRLMNRFISRLDEQQRRWYVAMEANQGGDHILSEITGMDEKTIQRGREELAASLVERPSERVRLPGAGRLKAEKRCRARTCLREGSRT